MASVDTTLRPPTDIRHIGQAEPRARSLDARLVDAPARRLPHDADGGLVGLAAGFGILLVQLCAITPGLLPGLLLAFALVLPVVVLDAMAVDGWG
jgi:hypothetical protein